MGWSELPPDLLLTIVGTDFTDHIRLRRICSGWRSSLKSLPLPPKLPWLVLPSNSSNHFYSLSDDSVERIRLAGDATNTSFLFGSASGWLLALKKTNRYKFAFSLINPFTGCSIGLPNPKTNSSLYSIDSDDLVWDRSASVVVVSSTCSDFAFYCRLEKRSNWKQIESLRNIYVRSLTFHKSKLYILENFYHDQTLILDGNTFEKLLVIKTPFSPSVSYTTTSLFVFSEESLFLLKPDDKASQKYGNSPVYNVYHMDLKKKEKKWRKVKDIGGRAIFVDRMRCFSVEVKDERTKLRRNCVYTAQLKIYETEEGNNYRKYDVFVFDLGTRELAQLEGGVSKFRVEGKFEYGELIPTWILPFFG